MATMQKWLVDVRCQGCLGLFYRSSPNVIVPDADWPRNGDIVVGYEIPNVPGKLVIHVSRLSFRVILIVYLRRITKKGWIRLQNGYYLPIHSDDGKIPFLHKVSTRAQPSNSEMKKIGSSTPLFRGSGAEQEDVASMLGGKIALAVDDGPVPVATTPEMDTATKEESSTKESKRAAVHMDAMAFGMGCCCLQITFQAKDVEESRFIYDQLAVMAPM